MQMTNLQSMNGTMQETATNMEILKTQKDVSIQIHQMHKQMGSVEKINRVMDKIKDTMDDAKDISEAMAQPLGEEMDETEIDEELAQLEAESAKDEATSVTIPKNKIEAEPTTVKVENKKVAIGVGGSSNNSSTSASSTGKAKADPKKVEEDDEMAQLALELGS